MRLTAKKLFKTVLLKRFGKTIKKNIEIYGMKSANWNTGIVSKSISDG
jgi:hypothetical protein